VRRAAGITILCLMGVAPAFAQYGGLGPGQPDVTHLRGGSTGSSGTAPRPSAPAPVPQRVQPDPWPRLDPGAMLCDSKDALMQYQEAVATAAGAPVPLQPGCTRVTQRMAVSVVQRDGPSRVQVKVTSPPRVGWTDAWLPASPP